MEKKQGTNQWLALTTISSQMVITIYLFYLLGSWLDGKFMLSNQIAMKISTLFGVFISIYQVIKQVNRLNNK